MLIKTDRPKVIMLLPADDSRSWVEKRWRQIENHIRKSLGLRRYYIPCDGVDDGQFFNEALEFLPKNPGGQVFCPGDYNCTTGIKVTESRANLVGLGMDASKIQAGADLNDFLLSFGGEDLALGAGGLRARFKLADLTLSGNGRIYDSTDGLLLYCGYSMYMSNVRIENFKGHGLKIQRWTDSVFLMPEIIRCGDKTVGNIKASLHIVNGVNAGNAGLTFVGGALEYAYWNLVLIQGSGTGALATKAIRFFGTKFAGNLQPNAAPYNLVTVDDCLQIGLYDCNFAAYNPGAGESLTALAVSGGTQNLKVVGNRFYGNANANNIYLTDADYCFIDGNHFGGGGPLNFDIGISAGGLYNFIGSGNQPVNSIVINDAGTGTVIGSSDQFISEEQATDFPIVAGGGVWANTNCSATIDLLCQSDLKVECEISWASDTVNAQCALFRFDLDGASQAGSTAIYIGAPVVSPHGMATTIVGCFSNVAAGTHTITVQAARRLAAFGITLYQQNLCVQSIPWP